MSAVRLCDAVEQMIIERRTGNALRGLMAGTLAPAKAVADGDIHLTGDPALLDRFAQIFHF